MRFYIAVIFKAFITELCIKFFIPHGLKITPDRHKTFGGNLSICVDPAVKQCSTFLSGL